MEYGPQTRADALATLQAHISACEEQARQSAKTRGSKYWNHIQFESAEEMFGFGVYTPDAWDWMDLYSTYSDAHKDLNGFRPRFGMLDVSYEELRQMYFRVQRGLEREFAREAAIRAQRLAEKQKLAEITERVMDATPLGYSLNIGLAGAV